MVGVRKVVVSAFIFCVVAVVAMAFVLERVPGRVDRFSQELPVQYGELRQESSGGIQAIVKGSIYQNGSNMTVVGACLTAGGALIEGSSAWFTAWYPNGTVLLGPNVSMVPILNSSSGPSGRFRIHVTMGSTVGTYLTEMRCVYGDQYALSFGEWQNPEWVVSIGDTYLSVLSLNGTLQFISGLLQNMSGDLDAFEQNVSANFSQVLQAINGLNISQNSSAGVVGEKLKEIYNLQRQIDGSVWVLDEKNPTYVIGSGQNRWRAVDMVDRNQVMVAGVNGTWGSWDGLSWSFDQVENATWFGVAVLPSAITYGWLVGRSGEDAGASISIYFNATGSQRPVYSVNGGNVQYVDEAWFNATNATTFVDGKLFMRPNDPGSPVYAFLLADTGHIVFSDDQGLTWQDFSVLYGASHMVGLGGGRISEVVENDDDAATEGFRVAFVMAGGSFAYFDGYNLTVLEGQGVTYRDVSVVREGEAYVLGTNETDGGSLTVWEYDGSVMRRVFRSQGVIVPAGIAAVSTDDIWVSTTDPSVYYHFDGERWVYQVFGVSQGLGVTLSFSSVSLVTGINDVVMRGQDGYAVGGDGLIMKFWSLQDDGFDEVLSRLGNLTVNLSPGALNLSAVQEQIQNLTDIVLLMNASLSSQVSDVQLKIEQMNASLQVKVDSVLNNVTYTQLYLENTIYPALTDILVQLGIIDAKLNTTIQLQNATLQLVNETNQGVQELLNRSDRPRAWTTQ